VLVQEQRVSLPGDRAMRADLVGTKQRVTQDGVKFVLPKTKDGRHGDYVPSLALGALFPPSPPDSPVPLVDEDLERAKARVAQRADAEWWESTIARVAGT
jgi:hypothetical protein